MIEAPHLDEIARLVGDPSRAQMLAGLMDGRAWTGRELAACANVSPSTASSHLARLVRGRLLSVFAQGRNRYYHIASPAVAQALESLMLLAPRITPRHASARKIAEDLQQARTCYDHLAGRLGVALADALVARGAIVFSESVGTLTEEGRALLEPLGVLTDERDRRPLCKPCLDWSERRTHLAGSVGSAIARAAFDREWVRRREGSRAVEVTERGIRELRNCFGVEWR
jgi:DNA-binding transcriptional ArsR family regulator